MTIPEKIKYYRIKNNMTLEELGNAVGVGKSTVRKWETGQIANMKIDKIEKLAAALKINPINLMGTSIVNIGQVLIRDIPGWFRA